MLYTVEILDNTLSLVTRLRVLVPINKGGVYLKYSKKLSDYGSCTFRVATEDPIFNSPGDILRPFKNFIRISKDGVTVWTGVVAKCPERNKDYIEVVGYSYLYLLTKVLVRHDPSDGKGAENYRTFKSGTIATALSTILTEAKTDMGGALTNLTTGTISNPSFPADFKDATGAALSGTWTFSDNFQLKVDFRDILYVVQLFGAYSNYDFELDESMIFNFQQFIGTKQPNIKFVYGPRGNVVDYNAPLDGERMANYIQGVAADNQFNILKAEMQDPTSINTYGKIAGVAAYADVKNENLLRARLREELNFVKGPDQELHIIVNESGYQVGEYDIGDTVTVQINDDVIQVDQLRRIVAIETSVQTTGEEMTKIITNLPRDNQ